MMNTFKLLVEERGTRLEEIVELEIMRLINLFIEQQIKDGFWNYPLKLKLLRMLI
ncbi:hypothetical protein HBHAL_3415 [Halobacillus halophilus DSM 2266]|uniref:Uncharacterized protein n=1 Tax=Halobacillus halophilus (strain ATCC 35676 / DSM 2266 / JCM 20832 / KCTC 3685 / LMG 17431 / NBRC 102448 / NCIMB 2269) TaxID=866895 RepID=I0JNN9_HALH3|nr:hypothetical protein HBHAL_3415 [Halobacillus halophilus DSM 2266]